MSDEKERPSDWERVLAVCVAAARRDGFYECRAAAVAYCNETAVMIGPNLGGVAHRMGVDIGQLEPAPGKDGA